MNRGNKPGFGTVIAILITVGCVIMAGFNIYQHRKYQPPYDGVTWQDAEESVVALAVVPGGPAERAGIRSGDELKSINAAAIKAATRVTWEIYQIGAWNRAEYALARQGQPFTAKVILEPQPAHAMRRYLQAVGLLYLGIGLFILLRRPNAPRSAHFYAFCLISFVLYFFSSTGKFNNFDWTVYWMQAVALLLQPPLFLHFALVFPNPKPWVERRRIILLLAYVPAFLLLMLHLSLAIDFLRVHLPALQVRWWLDRVTMLHLGAMYLGTAAVLYHTYRHAETYALRQQMKWVTRGTLAAILPFGLLYVVPYFRGAVPTPAMDFSVLTLALIPITFGYAIFRWRLMDVDILFRRTIAYTLATAALLGAYFTLPALAGILLQTALPAAGQWGLVIVVVATALLFQPLRDFIQDRLERYFYRESYDYRRTLAEFGRELSSDVDVDHILSSIVDRLSMTLNVERVAVFLASEDDPGKMRLERALGVPAGDWNLAFLDPARPEFARGALFFENVRQAVSEAPEARATIAQLDLHYYLPCKAHGRVVGVLGLGRTRHGELLTSEDVALLETLSGYLGAAIENARLYQRLERKAAQYERLKDFNENIVESVNVGILVLDLEDRIESWNTQVELMYGIDRDRAVGCKIDQVFPPALVAEMVRLRSGENPTGIHNLYKFQVKTERGEDRVFNVAVAPLVSKRFEMVGRLVIFDDITERMDLERQLAQADKLTSIGLLAAGVAHEVNTPLAVISSYAQMLAKQLPEGDPRWKLLDRITRSTFRASEIVNNLLNFSRTGEAEFTAVDLDRVISDTLALLDHAFRGARIHVDRRRDGDAPSLVQGSAGKLQQVFLNLFLNAREAMPEGGTLSITTTQTRDSVRVEVADTGEGIAPENIHRIYDPFFTTKPVRPRERPAGAAMQGGTGLGLSVTYGIVQEHSGRISVESEPRSGTRFVLSFPKLRERAASGATALAGD